MSEEPTREDIYAAKLNKELEKWSVLGLNVDNWYPTGGILAGLVRIEVMTDALTEAGLLDEEEATWAFRDKYLEKLQAIRKEMEPVIHQAKLDLIKQGHLRKH
jgi:hypothetical protein